METVVTEEYEGRYTLVRDKDYPEYCSIKPAGKKHFAKVLNSPIRLRAGKYLYVELQDKTITDEELEEFLAAAGGDVPNSLFEKWFGVKK
jgi:hypothetical protein